MSLWQGKLKAFIIHFSVTALVAVIAAALVFQFWLPEPFAEMMGGSDLFLLIIICDLVLGPMMSLVIFSTKKSTRQLLADYAVVVSIQIAAFFYGLLTVADLRPAFLVFTVDRYVVVSAGELAEEDWEKIDNSEWRKASLTGYHTVFVEKITDPQRNYMLIMSALAGEKDLQHITENYRPIGDHRDEVVKQAKPFSNLLDIYPSRREELKKIMQENGGAVEGLAWLPVEARGNFRIAIVDVETALPVAWFDEYPFKGFDQAVDGG